MRNHEAFGLGDVVLQEGATLRVVVVLFHLWAVLEVVATRGAYPYLRQNGEALGWRAVAEGMPPALGAFVPSLTNGPRSGRGFSSRSPSCTRLSAPSP